MLVPDSFDLLSLDTLDLSGREILRSKWAVDELLEFSLLLTEPEVSFGLILLTASGSREVFTLADCITLLASFSSLTVATGSEAALLEPFSSFRVLSLLSSEEASFPESMDMALRILRDWVTSAASSPSLAA